MAHSPRHMAHEHKSEQPIATLVVWSRKKEQKDISKSREEY